MLEAVINKINKQPTRNKISFNIGISILNSFKQANEHSTLVKLLKYMLIKQLTKNIS